MAQMMKGIATFSEDAVHIAIEQAIAKTEKKTFIGMSTCWCCVIKFYRREFWTLNTDLLDDIHSHLFINTWQNEVHKITIK